MSAPLLMLPAKENHIFDDLESFLHVLELMGIRFYRHSCSAFLPGSNWAIDPLGNASNSDFSGVVLPKYFGAVRRGPYTMGGTQKYQNLLAGRSAIDFKDRGSLEPNLGPPSEGDQQLVHRVPASLCGHGSEPEHVETVVEPRGEKALRRPH